MFRRLVLAGLLITFTPLAVLAGGIPIGPNVQVTDAGLGRFEDAERPEIAIQGGSLYAAWLDTRGGSSTQQPIYFARSDDGGTSWSANQRISLLSYVGFTERPVLSVAPDGSIWAAWWLQSCTSISQGECGGLDRANDVRLALSVDGGQSFGEYLAFDGNNSGPEIDGYPEIYAADDRTLLLIANPVSDEGAEILVRSLRRSGPGTLATQTVALSQGGNGRITDAIIPDGPRMSLAVRGDLICAAWEDRRQRFAIFGACSTDRGASFGANFQISGSDDFNPRLAFAPDGTLYAAYQDVEAGPLIVRRSTDNGVTWDAPNQAFDFDPSRYEITSYDLDVDPTGQVLITAALRSGAGFSVQSDLYLATSVDRGRRFALTLPLEDEQGEFPTVSTQSNPRTVIGSGPQGPRAFVIWADDRNTQDQIWFTRVDLDGTPPTAPPDVSAQGGDTSILLRWGGATDASGIAGYHVLRATAPGGPFTQITPRLVTATVYRDVGLDATPYFYQVYAVDGTGNPGPPSNTASAAASVGAGLGALQGTIAYEAGNSVAVRSIANGALGEQRVLGQGNTPTFRPDGQRVLLIAADNRAVVSIGPDGADPQPIYTTDTAISDLAVSADPNVIAAVHQRSYPGAEFCLAFEPRLVNLQPRQQLYSVDTVLASDIAVSGDRSLLAYTYRSWCNGFASGIFDSPRLCVLHIASQKSNCIDGADAEASDFAPGRATLVFSANFSGQRELWRAEVQADGTLRNFAQLTRGPAGQPSTAPRVSTDGTWVIFERDVDPGPAENSVLHAVRLDGDGLRSLGVSGKQPAWAGGGPPPLTGGGNFRAMLPLVRR